MRTDKALMLKLLRKGNMNIEEILEKVKSRFNGEKAGDYRGAFSSEIEGGNPKEFTIFIKDDGLEITKKLKIQQIVL